MNGPTNLARLIARRLKILVRTLFCTLYWITALQNQQKLTKVFLAATDETDSFSATDRPQTLLGRSQRSAYSTFSRRFWCPVLHRRCRASSIANSTSSQRVYPSPLQLPLVSHQLWGQLASPWRRCNIIETPGNARRAAHWLRPPAETTADDDRLAPRVNSAISSDAARITQTSRDDHYQLASLKSAQSTFFAPPMLVLVPVLVTQSSISYYLCDLPSVTHLCIYVLWSSEMMYIDIYFFLIC